MNKPRLCLGSYQRGGCHGLVGDQLLLVTNIDEDIGFLGDGSVVQRGYLGARDGPESHAVEALEYHPSLTGNHKSL